LAIICLASQKEITSFYCPKDHILFLLFKLDLEKKMISKRIGWLEKFWVTPSLPGLLSLHSGSVADSVVLEGPVV
jgi:hypothetical protein